MIRHLIWGALAAVAVILLPVFWGRCCVAIAVWAWRHGLVRTEFSPDFGRHLTALPWLIISFTAFAYMISMAVREYRAECKR